MSLRTTCGALTLAVAVAVSAIGCDSVRTRIYLNKGNELYTGQRYEEAIKEYEKVLAMDSNNWMANYLIAMSYVALYKPGSTHPKDVEYSAKGIEFLEKLVKMEAPSADDHQKVRGYYLNLLTTSERKDQALAFMLAEHEKDPKNLALISQIADLYQKNGDFPSALKYHQMRADLEPDNKETWYTIGVLCWARSYHGGMMVSQEEREQVVEQGLKALEKALDMDPNYFEALSYTNLLYREKAKALATAGRNVEAGEAYLKAEEYFKKAMEARKQSSPAKGKA